MISVDQIPFPWKCESPRDEEIENSQCASWYSSDSLIAPRSSHRVCFEEQMCVTGLDSDFHESSAPLLIRGRDISVDGVSFRHVRPLPYRHIQLLMPTTDGPEAVIVRLTWCRYSSQDGYVSGGYFVRPVEGHIARPDDWDTLDEA